METTSTPRNIIGPVNHDERMHFFAAFSGLSLEVISSGRVYQDYPSMTELLRIGGPISFSGSHPFLNEIEVDPGAELVVPAPADLFTILTADNAAIAPYQSAEELRADISEAYVQLFDALVEKGVTRLSIADHSSIKLIDNERLNATIRGGVDLSALAGNLIAVNNDAMRSFAGKIRFNLFIATSDRHLAPTSDFTLVSPRIFAESLADAITLECSVDGATDFSGLAAMAPEKPLYLTFPSGIREAKAEERLNAVRAVHPLTELA